MASQKSARASMLFQEFFQSEQSSGVILLFVTALALIIANSPIHPSMQSLLQKTLPLPIPGLHLSVNSWINEGLMVLFFILIGLEIEREVYSGELSNPRNALLPLLAALGGMAMPALIHFCLNRGLPTQAGFGIPMATDIAFALGILALLGKRIPPAARIFLAALAIADDLGAMVVIALGYSHGISIMWLGLAVVLFAALWLMNRNRVHRIRWYVAPGVLMWYCMLLSGVHTSIAGVMFAFALPYANGGPHSPSYRLEHLLNKPVAWLVMPLFAIANSGIVFSANLLPLLASANTLGIVAGLLLGKPLGIFGAVLATIHLGLAKLPNGLNLRHIIGLGILGGIGFTMATFIAVLAFGNSPNAEASKAAILLSSAFAGLIGFSVLRSAHTHPKNK